MSPISRDTIFLLQTSDPKARLYMGAADATLCSWDGAYPKGMHHRSRIPRHIEASAVGSHVKSTPKWFVTGRMAQILRNSGSRRPELWLIYARSIHAVLVTFLTGNFSA